MKKKRSIIAVILANVFLICCLSGMSAYATESDSSDDSVSIGTVIAPGEDEPLRDNPATIPGQWIYK